MATIYGTNGRDGLDGTPNDDIFYLKAGDDYAEGKGGDDEMHGGPGNDNLNGGAGNDTLFGEAGRDIVQGNGGRDVLVASDDDSLFGGAGGDFFRFDTANWKNYALVSDFDRTEDLVDLRKIDANWNRAGDQAYEYIGAHAFTGHAGELRYEYNADTNIGTLLGDNDGDGQADLAVGFVDVRTLGFSDILL